MAAAGPEVVDAAGSEPEDEGSLHVAWPEDGSLASRWEERAAIREQLRCSKRLLAWPSKVTIGVSNQSSLKLNKHTIVDLLNVWATTCTEPKAPPIQWIKKEAGTRFWGCCFQSLQNYTCTCTKAMFRLCGLIWAGGQASCFDVAKR